MKPENKKPVFRRKDVVVRSTADLFLPLACVFGCYVVLHGNSSPGGGFQGGVLVASAILLVYLGRGRDEARHAFRSSLLHSSETIAEILYVVIALVGIFTGLNFCVNFVFIGQEVETSVLMNDAVGYHVMAGITCLLIMMLGVLEPDDGEGQDDPTGKEGDAP
ncbi:MAG TPA: MnhB domain-containing protein [Candidatus Onthomonas avicola]|nr:MnhB domain-containing protein [Candidatus Onthomonas avicola]